MNEHEYAAVDLLPLAKLPVDSSPLRPYVRAAGEEMVREIHKLVPEYSRPADSRYGQRMQWSVNETVRYFVEAIGNPQMDWEPLSEIYVGIGAHEARKGRTLDGLQTAIRVCGQVASRRFISDARRLGWSLDTLSQLNDSLFVFLEKIASAAAQGYANTRDQQLGERQRLRARLRDLLISEPSASEDAIAALAKRAGWEVPRTIAVVAISRDSEEVRPLLPPAVLIDWHCPEPYMVVPDPERPARQGFMSALTEGLTAAIGPAVPLTRGAVSLRWARRLVGLIDEGVITAEPAARCMDHISVLVTSVGEELVEFAFKKRLGSLLQLPPHRRNQYARTLLEYVRAHDNAVIAAERLRVHEQTVRYRIRRLEELVGDAVHDPACRTELLLVLTFAVEMKRLDSELPDPHASSSSELWPRHATGDVAWQPA
ncbi:helix-turn-helix domain-containing protein [Actinomadura physcomitrii]|uniref:PucR family transcriptional regulator n=1 Tax=Actinomadura physcomitrii TaxID=2650748 RepID=UPI002E270A01